MNERQRVQLSVLTLFSVFTRSRPDTLLEDDSSLKNSEGSLTDDLLEGTLTDDSDGDTLVDDGSKSNAQNTKRPGTVCYGDIELVQAILGLGSIAYKESDSEKAEELYREARLALVRACMNGTTTFVNAAWHLASKLRGSRKGSGSKRVTQLFGVRRASLQGKTRQPTPATVVFMSRRCPFHLQSAYQAW
jgi:hypothetical protein